MNLYRRFIWKYAKLTLPLTELLKKADKAGEPPKGKPQLHKSGNLGKIQREWTWGSDWAFQRLTMTFTEALILQHFNPAKSKIRQMDAGGLVIAAFLNQYDSFGVPRLVNFYSLKCSSAEQNYDTYDRKLLAILEALKQWRQYPEGSNHRVVIRCDHKTLKYFETSKVLARRQDTFPTTLWAYDFIIKHLEGSYSLADTLCGRPPYEIGYEWPVPQLLATDSVVPYNDQLPAMLTAHASDHLAVKVSEWLLNDEWQTAQIPPKRWAYEKSSRDPWLMREEYMFPRVIL